MSSWARRMHRRAATIGNVVTSCGQPQVPYPRRLEKVKFGVPLEQVCKDDIPGPLLVLILKLNKEGPYKKDVFRAPGHQGNMKKLIHFMQNGRLVNIDNFSVYTIASVLKKFLRKLPDGIFGSEGEQQLFNIIQLESVEDQRDQIHRMLTTLPMFSQRMLVLLFGTFRVIAAHAERARTGMTSEALGVSVAPSFFQSCVSDGKRAKMEDVVRFKIATRIMKFIIDHFGVSNLFGRENYEYYARITGRILKVEEDWIFSFRYPPDTLVSPMSKQEESQSTPALLTVTDMEAATSASLGAVPEGNLLESYTRLSVSLEENGLFKVHERQAARMRTRSEWFLSPSPQPETLVPIDLDISPTLFVLRGDNLNRNSTIPEFHSSGTLGASAGQVNTETTKQPVRRTSSKDKERKLVRRSSSKNKENGAGATSGSIISIQDSGKSSPVECSPKRVTEQDCTETDVQTFHVTLTYKPRI